MGRRTKEEQVQEAKQRLQQAIAYKQKHKLQDAPEITASCALLGNRYGVGIGLYFKVLGWLRLLLFWLALAAVPYIIVVNTARFTTAEYRGQAGGPGTSVLQAFNILQSWTFAALPDNTAGSILTWLNIQLPGFDGVFVMSRHLFLTWVSLVDAGSMAVFSIACLLLYKFAHRFVKAVDNATMEVADYTVVIKGLPETTPVDIGHHFSRWGRVMDVVMVKDFGPLLNLAATATALEQQRKAAESKLANGRKAAAYQRHIRKAEKKMKSFMQQANSQLDSSGFELKAVFVTFNTQGQAAACMAHCPRRWLSSWLQPRRDRFLNRYRFWVEQAHPPEDYIYENLSVSRLSGFIRMVVVRLVVFAILLASAGAVTKLMAMNIESARNVVWDNADMDSRINIAMQAYSLTTSESMLAPMAANATLKRVATMVGDQAAQDLAGSYYPQLSYCSVQLEQDCSQGLGGLLSANLTMRAAEGVSWGSLQESLLKREDFLSVMSGCSKPGSSCPSLSMCHPCHCSMLSKVTPAMVVNSDWVLAVRQECSAFMGTLDIHRSNAYVMKGLISFVLVVLNFVLKFTLHLLVEFEKHWTQSDKERAYAVLAFVSQLLNSVLVLLLVNAQSSIASAAINATLNSGSASKYTSWGANLILSGAYTDFSPGWYVDVGQSLELLIILNAVVTGAFTMAMWLQRKLHQCFLVNCMPTASQSAYNAAWIGMEFVLDSRVSDIMLGLWIILMFGSGMPGLYIFGLIWLLVVELTDRWSLAMICQTPARYGQSLPFLLLGVLPWAAATHCAFGLWMHTRFDAGHVGGQEISDLASSAGGTAAQLSRTYAFLRITQTNGLPLLILLVAHLGIHVVIRFLFYFFSGEPFIKMCGCEGPEDHADNSANEVPYEAALLARYGADAAAAAANAGGGSGGGGAGSARPSRTSNACTTSIVALAGAPTYRLPHHPRYSDIFSNPLYKPIWFKAFGRLRYTTLLSRPGGGFIIAPEAILDHDQSDMEQSLASMPTDLQNMARRLADGNSSGDGHSKRRAARSSLLGAELQAMRERSMSVQVAVMAGLGFDSPRGSFTASPFRSPRARSQTEGPAAHAAARLGAQTAASSFTTAAAPAASAPSQGTSFTTDSFINGPLSAGVAASAAVDGPEGVQLSFPSSEQHSMVAAHAMTVAPPMSAAGAAALAAVAADLRSGAVLLDNGNAAPEHVDPSPSAYCMMPQHAVHGSEFDSSAAALPGPEGFAATPAWLMSMPGPPTGHGIEAAAAMAAAANPGHQPWSAVVSATSSGACVAYAVSPDGLPVPLLPVVGPDGHVCYYPASSVMPAAADAALGPPGVHVQEPAATAAVGTSPSLSVPLQLQQPSTSTIADAGNPAGSIAASSEDQLPWLAAGRVLGAGAYQEHGLMVGQHPASTTVSAVEKSNHCGTKATGSNEYQQVPLTAPVCGSQVPQQPLATAPQATDYHAAAGIQHPVDVQCYGREEGPGWMHQMGGAADDSSVPHAFSLWDGALAAAASAQPLAGGASASATATAAAATPGHADVEAAIQPPAGSTGSAFFYPQVHLSRVEIPSWYPNVHLTTVEMPEGCLAPEGAVDSSHFSNALLAGNRAPDNLSGWPEQLQQQQQQQHYHQQQQQQYCQQQQQQDYLLQQQQQPEMHEAAGPSQWALQGQSSAVNVSVTAAAAPQVSTPQCVVQEPFSALNSSCIDSTCIQAVAPSSMQEILAGLVVPPAAVAAIPVQAHPSYASTHPCSSQYQAAGTVQAGAGYHALSASAVQPEAVSTAPTGLMQLTSEQQVPPAFAWPVELNPQDTRQQSTLQQQQQVPELQQQLGQATGLMIDPADSSSDDSSEEGCSTPRELPGGPAAGSPSSVRPGSRSGGKKVKHKKSKKGKKTKGKRN